MGLIKVWQVRGMGEDFFGYFEKKRRERGNREKKERKSKKNGII